MDSIIFLSENHENYYDIQKSKLFFSDGHICEIQGNSKRLLDLLTKHEDVVFNHAQLSEMLECYDNANGIYPGDEKNAVRSAIKQLREELHICKACIRTSHNVGYKFKCIDNPRKIHKDKKEENKQNKTGKVSSSTLNYYKTLWKKHCRGYVKDHPLTDSQTNTREIIDYYVLPNITDLDNNTLITPFSEDNFRIFVTSGSGYGKTTLLHMILLANIFPELYNSNDKCLSENSKANAASYMNIKESLFGKKSPDYFPVLIHSDEYNKRECQSILKLVEANGREYDLLQMIECAENSGTLLFLIDALDEVKSEKQNPFLEKIEDLLRCYPNASLIITSRFIERKYLPFECTQLHVSELDITRIERIFDLFVSRCLNGQKAIKKAEEKLEKIKEEKQWYELAKNPYMLLSILDYNGDDIYLCKIIDKIVDNILRRRWDWHNELKIKVPEVKLLLGGLACSYIFSKNKNDALSQDVSQVRRSLQAAQDIIKDADKYYTFSEYSIDNMIEILSNHSGILNINLEDNGIRYVFQDNLIMCWLAAYYISSVIGRAEIPFVGTQRSWEIACWIRKIICRFSDRTDNISLSDNATTALVLAINYADENEAFQIGILYYLFFQDATSIDLNEKQSIIQGFNDIICETYGGNEITNDSKSPYYKMIENATKKYAIQNNRKNELL